MSSCGLYTSARWLTKRLAFSVSLFAQGLGGLVFAQIGGSGVRSFFLDLIGFQMIWSSHLSEAMYAVKVALLISCSAPRSLLFALLKRRLSSGVWVFCHFALALRFCATSCLMCEGRLFACLGLFLTGVAVVAACCSISMSSVVATSMSSRVLSFCIVANFSLIIVLYNFQSVCDMWSLVAGIRVAIEVLSVTTMGV